MNIYKQVKLIFFMKEQYLLNYKKLKDEDSTALTMLFEYQGEVGSEMGNYFVSPAIIFGLNKFSLKLTDKIGSCVWSDIPYLDPKNEKNRDNIILFEPIIRFEGVGKSYKNIKADNKPLDTNFRKEFIYSLGLNDILNVKFQQINTLSDYKTFSHDAEEFFNQYKRFLGVK